MSTETNKEFKQKAEEDYQDLVDKRQDLVGTLTGAQVEYDVGMAKANKKTATENNFLTLLKYQMVLSSSAKRQSCQRW